MNAKREIPGDTFEVMPGVTSTGDDHLRGFYSIALQNAFHQLLYAENFYQGMLNTMMIGGDTDTNGCIAGTLLGAR